MGFCLDPYSHQHGGPSVSHRHNSFDVNMNDVRTERALQYSREVYGSWVILFLFFLSTDLKDYSHVICLRGFSVMKILRAGPASSDI